MLKGNIYVVIDGQAGSCGKGKFVGYFARNKRIDVSINNNTPNAGHTFIFADGRKIITTHLPMAVVEPNIQLLIGAGAAIDPIKLMNEIEEYKDLLGNRKVYIHERAAIVLDNHKEIEQETIKSGSTFKGTAASLCDKMMRKPGVILAKDYKWNNNIELFNDDLIIEMLENDKNILIETSQGFDLDINHGLDYPNVTSKQCTVMQSLADCGIPQSANIITYMVFRPYPIRISNETKCGNIYSGDYGMSKELLWEDIEALSGCKNVHELTTITQKLRRVFEFEWKRFYHACMINSPQYLILNFAQYLDVEAYGKNDVLDLLECEEGSNKVADFIEDINQEYGIPIAYVGTGAKEDQIVDMNIDEYSKNGFPRACMLDDEDSYSYVKKISSEY